MYCPKCLRLRDAGIKLIVVHFSFSVHDRRNTGLFYLRILDLPLLLVLILDLPLLLVLILDQALLLLVLILDLPLLLVSSM